MLAQIGKALGPCDRVDRLHAHSIEEQAEPTVKLAPFTNAL